MQTDSKNYAKKININEARQSLLELLRKTEKLIIENPNLHYIVIMSCGDEAPHDFSVAGAIHPNLMLPMFVSAYELLSEKISGVDGVLKSGCHCGCGLSEVEAKAFELFEEKYRKHVRYMMNKTSGLDTRPSVS